MSVVTAKDIREWLLEMYAEKFEQLGIASADVFDETDLLREGIIDSLGILEMFAALEERFGAALDFSSEDTDDLTQVGALTRFVEKKLRSRDSAGQQPVSAPGDAASGVTYMTLAHALEILKKPVEQDASRLKVFLATGFTPLHLQTFLTAQLRELFPDRTVDVQTGLFGDLAGNLERMQPEEFDSVVVMTEWADLDARLGVRSLGGWQYGMLADIVESAAQHAARLEKDVRNVSRSVPVIVSLPSLPFPPLFPTRLGQAGAHELRLREIVASLSATISNNPKVRVVSSQRLDEVSPPAERFNISSEITAGFPYAIAHASILAELLAGLVRNPVPKKGIITDLDDTFWAGILGEVGVQGVSWDMDHHSQMHGLYQQLLASLVSAGILIGVASKNDAALVEQAFGRKDLRISKASIYPCESGWDRKSESIRRILETWNVGADSVVFIDDSPMELAEVESAFPEIECLLFPTNDYEEIWELLGRLRELFGKSVVREEDSIRMQSIRSASTLRESTSGAGASLDAFLEGAHASIFFRLEKQEMDARALELINKTNQFNLNGRRTNESACRAYLKDPGAFLLTATYEDKYGPLGKIAAMMGTRTGKTFTVDYWVMSCRAFSRRIEHEFLKCLFEQFPIDEIAFEFEATDRNGPLQDFFSKSLGVAPAPRLRLSRSRFFEKLPPLFHEVVGSEQKIPNHDESMQRDLLAAGRSDYQ